jgi:hypothetical protein
MACGGERGKVHHFWVCLRIDGVGRIDHLQGVGQQVRRIVGMTASSPPYLSFYDFTIPSTFSQHLCSLPLFTLALSTLLPTFANPPDFMSCGFDFFGN